MASWSTWPTRSAPGGDNRGFGVYSGLTKRGSQPMSRTLMAADKEVPQLSDERRKALNLAITQIEKTCGKGAIMRMGADSPRERVEGIPTGAINLDAAIGIGGIPRSRGPESSWAGTRRQTTVARA